MRSRTSHFYCLSDQEKKMYKRERVRMGKWQRVLTY